MDDSNGKAKTAGSTIIEQVFWLAVNLYHEAGSLKHKEPIEGLVAICHVVWNRARKRHLSLKDVILQPYQFSWHNNNALPPIQVYNALERCIEAAMMAVAERMEGKDLFGADHYFADYIQPPAWSKKMTRVTKIGTHIFFRE